MPPASHELLDHIGELRLRLQAATMADLAAEATRALGSLAGSRPPATAERVSRPVEAEADDPGALLVEWLNQLLYLAERHRWVPQEAALAEASDRRLRGMVEGALVEQAPALVKAATLHDLRFERVKGGLVAEITLDI